MLTEKLLRSLCVCGVFLTLGSRTLACNLVALKDANRSAAFLELGVCVGWFLFSEHTHTQTQTLSELGESKQSPADWRV